MFKEGVRLPAFKILLWVTFALVFFGLVMVYSSSSAMAGKQFNDPYFFVKRQAAWLALGVLFFTIVVCVKQQTIHKCILPLLIISLVLAIMVFIPHIGLTVKGATRWIKIGSFRFQPSELVKLTVITYIAFLLGRRDDNGINKPSLLTIFSITQVPVVLILLERDLGSPIIIEAFLVLLLFMAGMKLRYLLIIFLAACPTVYALIITAPHRTDRILAWLYPWEFTTHESYQIVNSWISMGTGGLTGVGLGRSTQKLFYLPEAHTDYIAAIIGEEFGLVGMLMLILAFLVIFICGVYVANKQKTATDYYMALALTCLIVLPAFTNLAVVTGVVPTKGLTLPFISYGGSNLLISLVAMGILINLSRQVEEEA